MKGLNVFALFGMAGQLLAAIAGLTGGAPTTFRTYIRGKHVEVTVAEIP